MSFNDPIGEFLTKVRNATSARHRFVDVHLNKMKLAIVKIMQEQGFIENYLVDESRGLMRIFLKYNRSRQPIIHGLKRVSTPGLRKYVGYREISSVFNGMGVGIVSTPDGIITDVEARKKRKGGEYLCCIW